MPAQRLDPRQPTHLPKYSVIAFYSNEEPTFVQHVALLREKASVKSGEEVLVFHARPPIVAGKDTDAVAQPESRVCPAHIGAYMEDLTLDEMKGITTALEDIDQRMASLPRMPPPGKQYKALPPCDWMYDEKTGRQRYRRFSCSGFVAECYKKADIILVPSDHANLPNVDLPLILKAYPGVSRVRLRKAGLEGNGPWPVLMAGYIVNSLDRDSADIRKFPYVPKDLGDAYFPPSSKAHF